MFTAKVGLFGSAFFKTKSTPLKQEFIRLWRNEAAKKYHGEFAVLKFKK